ncbi:hypothetical protein PSP6_410027 [Paraburkholderia tropica]|nr:hypothetical protein PSP6_410027 [Paraburkholderia tropica]
MFSARGVISHRVATGTSVVEQRVANNSFSKKPAFVWPEVGIRPEWVRRNPHVRAGEGSLAGSDRDEKRLDRARLIG